MGLFDLFKKAPASPPSPTVDAPRAADLPAEADSPLAGSREQPASETPPTKKSWLARIRDSLHKTSQILNTDIRDLFKAQGQLLDDEFLDKLRAILIKTDMGPAAANKICERVQRDFRARVLTMRDLLASVEAELLELLAQEGGELRRNPAGPTIIMVAGVNGSGKTTSIAKLTRMFRQRGERVILGAGDTFRAAAVQQLTIWAERLGAEIVTAGQGADPASVAHRAVDTAITGNYDVCIVDTAGRLQTQQNLMDELGKIHRVIGKRLPDAPHEVLLVLDGTSGQNAISQARGFTAAVNCTGIVLSKIDGTAKGGVVIPIRQQFGLPVKFVGVGEQADDLIPFSPQTFVQALFSGLTEELG
ncbi:MAG: signal recognition particle-docking protein FtsY [Pirellulales bacterium]|nr:signal recognition particle-docking protein FtsY [Pirellulales bacterium]